MRVIYKYSLGSVPTNESLLLPKGAEVVSVNSQTTIATGRGTPHLWVLCDPDLPTEERRFSVLATGEPFPDDAVYVGTWHESYFVWHVVEHR